EQRYPTAAALAEDLRRFLSDRPLLARRSSWRERGWRWCRRNPAVAGLTAAVVLLLVLAVVVLAISNLWINDALTQAKTNEEVATERALDLARRIYIYRINLAHREVLANNVALADALLDDCEPARRGWEWAYTKRLCHLEATTLGGFRDHAS